MCNWLIRFSTRPSASTTSSPRHSARVEPKRSTFDPPALVDSTPPMVADPRAPNHKGKFRPSASAASCRCVSTTPASTTASFAAGLISRMRFIRSSVRISPPLVIVPPTSPVSPPAATTGTPARAAAASTCATSAVLPGRATATGSATYRPIQSRQ